MLLVKVYSKKKENNSQNSYCHAFCWEKYVCSGQVI